MFIVSSEDGDARAGVMHTQHGDFNTPAFMPVATQGSVKAIDTADLMNVRASILLANSYHLSLRPGVDVMESMGGLHRFMDWSGPILTDSGGFQGFSLAHLRKVTDDAIVFKSHIDGTTHIFTPETAVKCQEIIGADIIMPLDVCVPSNSDRLATEEAVGKTTSWANRSMEAQSYSGQILFGIVQGGMFKDLRERSVKEITSLGFPGYAIGGLSVGESKSQMYEIASFTTSMLPSEMPRYLMGVGSPEDLVESVARGVDMFDCVLPTRVARNGSLFTRKGRINIANSSFKTIDGPIDVDCDCKTCTTYSVAYVHHLFRAKELLAYRLATIHNLRFILRLMEEIRVSIIEGRFESYRNGFQRDFVASDEKVSHSQKLKWIESQSRTRVI